MFTLKLLPIYIFPRKVRIYGVGFLSVPGAVILRFTGVNGKSMEVQGTLLDDEVVECSTPKARKAS